MAEVTSQSDVGAQRRSVTVLGATGSVGKSTADILRHGRDRFAIEALTAHRDVEGLAALAIELEAKHAVIGDSKLYGDLKARLAGSSVEAAAGRDAVIEAADRPAEMVVAAIVGAAGLEPTLAAVRRGALIALANKECLVCAGAVMTAEVARCGARLLPIDSEHNAIFQAMAGSDRSTVERIILTASGGPFRDFTVEQMAQVTPAQAVAHPNWSMGAKISVDSATMMNKGLEIIEACHLFGLPERDVDVLVHRQSIVHSLATFKDGSTLAQLSPPDMRVPIAHVLAWPERMAWPAQALDLAELADLSFERPDTSRFPALRLAREVLRTGGAAPTLLNAANEIAVAAFLDRQIGYLDIARIAETVLEQLEIGTVGSVDEVLHYDHAGRAAARQLIEAHAQAPAALRRA